LRRPIPAVHHRRLGGQDRKYRPIRSLSANSRQRRRKGPLLLSGHRKAPNGRILFSLERSRQCVHYERLFDVGITMKGSVSLLFVLMASSSMAHREDTPINSGSELRDWCKEESEATLIGKGLTPFNWSASYWDQGNVLMAKGKWRVNGSDVTVECRVARGAEARFAMMSIQDSQ